MIGASFPAIALRVFRLRRRDFAPPGPASCRIRRAISAGIVPERRAADMGDAQPGAGSRRVRCRAPLVCERRAFYGLMTFDETGVLRT